MHFVFFSATQKGWQGNRQSNGRGGRRSLGLPHWIYTPQTTPAAPLSTVLNFGAARQNYLSRAHCLGSHFWGKSLRLQLIVNSLSQRPALLFDPFDNRGVLELPCQSLAFLLVPLTVIRPQPLQHLESASLCR